jgi:ABC-type branched-subunit amino acid transport system substrate-binding protein/outer membrane protein assembly factor BamD (BamD/ComL family)
VTGARILRVLAAALVLVAASANGRALVREGAVYRPTQTADGQADFREGVRLQSEGKYDAALAAYARVIERAPRGDYVDDALYRSGMIESGRGNYAAAEAFLVDLLRRFPDGPFTRDGGFLLGTTRFEAKRYREAIDALRAYLDLGTGLAMISRAQSTIARCHGLLGEPGEALAWYQRAYLSTRAAPTREVLLADVDALLAVAPDPESLLAVVQTLDAGPVRDRAQLRLAAAYSEEGKENEAELVLSAVAEGATQGATRLAARERSRRAPDTGGDVPTLGLVLPLTGKFAPFGEQALSGVLLGIGFFDAPGERPIRVRIEDTQGSPAVAAAAVERLAADPDVIAILGPLLSATAQTAADAAEKAGVPIVVMSRKEGITRGTRDVFRHFLTDSQQVRELVAYASREHGATRFSVLYPENAGGRALRDLLVAEVGRRDLTVLAAVGYNPALTDYKVPIRRLAAAGAPDAVFLPDFHDRVVMIAPQLPYYGVNGALLLGTSEWNHPELVRVGGRFLGRCAFTDAFFKDSARPAVTAFVRDYRGRGDADPTVLAAFGYDTARIARQLVAERNATTRGAFREALHEVRGWGGVTGTTTFGEGGDAEKSLFLLHVAGGRIEEIP